MPTSPRHVLKGAPVAGGMGRVPFKRFFFSWCPLRRPHGPPGFNVQGGALCTYAHCCCRPKAAGCIMALCGAPCVLSRPRRLVCLVRFGGLCWPAAMHAICALNEQHGSTPEQGKPEMNRSIPLEIDSRGQHIERNSGGFMTQGWGGWRRERKRQAEARGTRGRNEVIRVSAHPGLFCRSRAAHTTRHLARGKQARGRKGRGGGRDRASVPPTSSAPPTPPATHRRLTARAA